MTERTCTVEGCGRKHRARGLCVSHYNAEVYGPDRHRRTITCAECGAGHETTRWDGRYCSLWCRDAKGRRRKALVGPLPRPERVPLPDPPAPPIPRLFIAGTCAWCKAPFVGRFYGTPDRYCSPACGRSATDRRHAYRHAHRYQKWIDPARRYAIYTRDRWECQLCGERVDPALPYNHDWAASLDHIVPRSEGGDHSDANLRLAHRWCNAVRPLLI